jgi:3-phosphoshikimate 1-carboxyvinyltransferase
MELPSRQYYPDIIQLPKSSSAEDRKLNVTVTPLTAVKGEIWAPPSKAHTHRALFAGLLSRGLTQIVNPLSCDDTNASAAAVASLGAGLERTPNAWVIKGNGFPTAFGKEIQCGESGVTLRFTIPVASLTGEKTKLICQDRLLTRPIKPLIQGMKQLGVNAELDGNTIIVDGGPPKGGRVSIQGNVSSQFISGLLLAGPLMEDGLTIELTSSLESRSYVLLTMSTMRRHGVEVDSNDELSTFTVTPKRSYLPAVDRIPGDFSSAAFTMSAAALTNSRLLIHGLPHGRSEPDAVVAEILAKMGVGLHLVSGGLLVEGTRLKGIDIDLQDCPDLGPILAVLGCYAEGRTRITGAGRLRYKESNRLESIASELGKLGAEIEETESGLTISGPCSLAPGTVDSHGDHRIAMALCVAALRAMGPVVIKNAECVSKSYPAFFDDLRSIGVEMLAR